MNLKIEMMAPHKLFATVRLKGIPIAYDVPASNPTKFKPINATNDSQIQQHAINFNHFPPPHSPHPSLLSQSLPLHLAHPNLHSLPHLLTLPRRLHPSTTHASAPRTSTFPSADQQQHVLVPKNHPPSPILAGLIPHNRARRLATPGAVFLQSRLTEPVCAAYELRAEPE